MCHIRRNSYRFHAGEQFFKTQRGQFRVAFDNIIRRTLQAHQLWEA